MSLLLLVFLCITRTTRSHQLRGETMGRTLTLVFYENEVQAKAPAVPTNNIHITRQMLWGGSKLGPSGAEYRGVARVTGRGGKLTMSRTDQSTVTAGFPQLTERKGPTTLGRLATLLGAAGLVGHLTCPGVVDPAGSRGLGPKITVSDTRTLEEVGNDPRFGADSRGVWLIEVSKSGDDVPGREICSMEAPCKLYECPDHYTLRPGAESGLAAFKPGEEDGTDVCCRPETCSESLEKKWFSCKKPFFVGIDESKADNPGHDSKKCCLQPTCGDFKERCAARKWPFREISAKEPVDPRSWREHCCDSTCEQFAADCGRFGLPLHPERLGSQPDVSDIDQKDWERAERKASFTQKIPSHERIKLCCDAECATLPKKCDLTKPYRPKGRLWKSRPGNDAASAVVDVWSISSRYGGLDSIGGAEEYDQQFADTCCTVVKCGETGDFCRDELGTEVRPERAGIDAPFKKVNRLEACCRKQRCKAVAVTECSGKYKLAPRPENADKDAPFDASERRIFCCNTGAAATYADSSNGVTVADRFAACERHVARAACPSVLMIVEGSNDLRRRANTQKLARLFAKDAMTKMCTIFIADPKVLEDENIENFKGKGYEGSQVSKSSKSFALQDAFAVADNLPSLDHVCVLPNADGYQHMTNLLANHAKAGRKVLLSFSTHGGAELQSSYGTADDKVHIPHDSIREIAYEFTRHADAKLIVLWSACYSGSIFSTLWLSGDKLSKRLLSTNEKQQINPFDFGSDTIAAARKQLNKWSGGAEVNSKWLSRRCPDSDDNDTMLSTRANNDANDQAEPVKEKGKCVVMPHPANVVFFTSSFPHLTSRSAGYEESSASHDYDNVVGGNRLADSFIKAVQGKPSIKLRAVRTKMWEAISHYHEENEKNSKGNLAVPCEQGEHGAVCKACEASSTPPDSAASVTARMRRALCDMVCPLPDNVVDRDAVLSTLMFFPKHMAYFIKKGKGSMTRQAIRARFERPLFDATQSFVNLDSDKWSLDVHGGDVLDDKSKLEEAKAAIESIFKFTSRNLFDLKKDHAHERQNVKVGVESDGDVVRAFNLYGKHYELDHLCQNEFGGGYRAFGPDRFRTKFEQFALMPQPTWQGSEDHKYDIEVAKLFPPLGDKHSLLFL